MHGSAGRNQIRNIKGLQRADHAEHCHGDGRSPASRQNHMPDRAQIPRTVQPRRFQHLRLNLAHGGVIQNKAHTGEFPYSHRHQHKQRRIRPRQPVHRDVQVQEIKDGLQQSLRGKQQAEHRRHGGRGQDRRNENNALEQRRQFDVAVQDHRENEAQRVLDHKGDHKIDCGVLQAFPEHLVAEQLLVVLHPRRFPDRAQAVPVRCGKVKGEEHGVIDNNHQILNHHNHFSNSIFFINSSRLELSFQIQSFFINSSRLELMMKLILINH